MSNLVYVDINDVVVGAGPKRKAYDEGIPHRSVRIFLTNSSGKVLIARRSQTVKILPGRWGESVAGHVDEGEEYIDAAYREMQEELRIHTELTPIGKFFVDITDGPRHIVRFNTVFTGMYDEDIGFNTDEVAELEWLTPSELSQRMEQHAGDFTPGCVKSFELFLTRLTT